MLHQTITPRPDAISQNPRHIEAQLDRDRDALSAALEALRDRFSPDNLWSDGQALLKANAGPYTQALDTAVRANPVALALAAVGVAWLVLGRRGLPEGDNSVLAGTRFEAEARWEDEGGPVCDLPDADALWMEKADRLRLRADGLIGRINAALRDGLASANALTQNRRDVMASLALDIRRVMATGLEGLTGSARDAAMAARERAYVMRIAAGKAGAATVRNNPVVTGVALAAAGAAVAVMLPRSALENRLLGLPRDQLVRDAKCALQDERQRIARSVARLAQALSDELSPAKAGAGVRPADTCGSAGA